MADERVFKQSALKRLKDTYRSSDLVLPPLQRHVMRSVTQGREDWRDDYMHPSEMVKPDWCGRRDYYRITGHPSEKVSSRNPSFTMENIWNEGHAIEGKYQGWLWEMGVLWGRWECQQNHRWEALAPDFCPTCSDRHLRYLEVHLQAPRSLVEGHADGAIHGLDGFGNGLLEVKSIGIAGLRFDAPRLHQRYLNGESLEDIWFSISRPFGVHIKQGMMYLWLAWPRYEKIVFLYESKFHQRTKEFVITYNRSVIQSILAQAHQVAVGVRNLIAPDRPVWAAPAGRICSSCGYRRTCWNLEVPSAPKSDPVPIIVRRAKAADRSALFEQPEYDLPGVPQDITTMGDENLMTLFSQFVAWQNYAATLLAEAEVEEERAEARLRHTQAVGLVAQWGGPKDSVNVAKAQRDLTDEVQEVQQEVLNAYAQRKMTAVMYNNIDRTAALVSRELSRRLGREPRERRAARFGP